MRQSYRGFDIFRLYNTRYICAMWKTYLVYILIYIVYIGCLTLTFTL